MLPMLLFCFYARNALLSFGDEELPYYLWNKQICRGSSTEQYDVVILGDSVANAAYMPELLSGRTINLALGGTTPMEAYYILCEYLASHDKPKVVYMSFLDSHFIFDDCFYVRTLYSHRFPFGVNCRMLHRGIEFEEPSIAMDDARMKLLEYAVYAPSKYITSFMNGGINQRMEENSQIMMTDDAHYGRYIGVGNMVWGTPENMEFSEFLVNPLFDRYYQDIIGLCEDNGITVRLVKLPLTDCATFSSEYLREYESYYMDIKNQYENVTVDWISAYDISDFYDDHHMNSHGAFRLAADLKHMYSGDFSEDMSDKRVSALNDDICIENDFQWLFRWINQGDYSVSIWKDTDADGKKYSLSDDMELLYDEEGTLDLNTVKLNIHGEEYLWSIDPNANVSVFVFDNYHSQVVTIKNFSYQTDIMTQL